MQLAYSTLACPAWSLRRALAEARRLGCEGLELRLLDGQLIEPDLPRSERDRVRQLLLESGIGLVTVDSSIRLVSEHPEAEVESALRSFLELASDWSAPLVRVFGGSPPEGMSSEEAAARAARLLERAAPLAARLGVRVGLETHDSFSAAAVVAQALAGAPSPEVGVIWDLLHTHRMGEAPFEVWELVGPRVLSVHVKDARRASDGAGWDLVPLGEGEVPVRECLAVLRSSGYDGWLVVEWEKRWHPEIDEPEVALPHEVEVLRRWLAGGQAGR